ncbi:MAG: hypothetical protein KF900_02880 [Bacteroidetes bacterium]|nr:hypothetical protein [Bacteroidota bacterium]
MAATKTTKRKKAFNPEDEPGMMVPMTKDGEAAAIKYAAELRAKTAAKKKKSSVA